MRALRVSHCTTSGTRRRRLAPTLADDAAVSPTCSVAGNEIREQANSERQPTREHIMRLADARIMHTETHAETCALKNFHQASHSNGHIHRKTHGRADTRTYRKMVTCVRKHTAAWSHTYNIHTHEKPTVRANAMFFFPRLPKTLVAVRCAGIGVVHTHTHTGRRARVVQRSLPTARRAPSNVSHLLSPPMGRDTPRLSRRSWGGTCRASAAAPGTGHAAPSRRSRAKRRKNASRTNTSA